MGKIVRLGNGSVPQFTGNVRTLWFDTSDTLGNEVAGRYDVVESRLNKPMEESFLRVIRREGDGRWIVFFNYEGHECGGVDHGQSVEQALVQGFKHRATAYHPYFVLDMLLSEDQSPPPPESDHWKPDGDKWPEEGVGDVTDPEWGGRRYSHVVIHTPPLGKTLREWVKEHLR